MNIATYSWMSNYVRNVSNEFEDKYNIAPISEEAVRQI